MCWRSVTHIKDAWQATLLHQRANKVCLSCGGVLPCQVFCPANLSFWANVVVNMVKTKQNKIKQPKQKLKTPVSVRKLLDVLFTGPRWCLHVLQAFRYLAYCSGLSQKLVCSTALRFKKSQSTYFVFFASHKALKGSFGVAFSGVAHEGVIQAVLHGV